MKKTLLVCSHLTKNISGMLCVSVLFLSTVSYVLANEIEEVIVEGQVLESQPLDDLVSVSVIDAEKLADAGIENVEDAAAYVPNLVLTETVTGTSICIRGICAGANQGFDQSVGLYIDKVPQPRANMARAPFMDLQNFQALRGPQYVLDGNYSIAGSIHLQSNLSQEEFAAGVDFNYAPELNESKLLLKLGGPISDKFAANIALQAKSGDSHVENLLQPGNGTEELAARIVLGFSPTDSLAFKLKIEQGSFDRTGGAPSEIFFAGATPTIDLTPQSFNGLRQRVAIHPGDNGSSGFPITLFETPDDYRLKIGTFYDAAKITGFTNGPFTVLVDALPTIPNDPDSDQVFADPGLFYFGGRTVQQKFAEIYAGDNLNSEFDYVAYQANVDPSFVIPAASAPLPEGLLDVRQDFRRSTDTEERSENDSTNITLNTDYYLGEHAVSLTASYIEYEFEERLDGDLMPVDLFRVNQVENYEQSFFRLDYKSPEGGFFELDAGVSYLDSNLEFNDLIDINIRDRVLKGDLPSLVASPVAADPDVTNVSLADPTFYADEPLRAYFGGFVAGNIAVGGLEVYNAERFFEQENAITAAFFRATLNFTDTLRAYIGARYTYSEKSATRDYALVDKEGNIPDFSIFTTGTADDIRDFAQEYADASRDFLRFFGIQAHTDRYPREFFNEQESQVGTLCQRVGVTERGFLNSYCFDDITQDAVKGDRTEESLLPSLTLEWEATDSLTLRAGVRQAGKLGGFDARSNIRPDPVAAGNAIAGTFEFEDEKAISYEAGVNWYAPLGLDGQLNATAFVTKYRDLQTTRFDGRTGFNVDNAGAATSTGLEVEGYLQLTDKLNLNYSLAWLDFEYDDFIFGACRPDERPDNFVINNPNGAPQALGLGVGTVIEIVYEDAPFRTFPSINRNGDPNNPIDLTAEGVFDVYITANGVGQSASASALGDELLRRYTSIDPSSFDVNNPDSTIADDEQRALNVRRSQILRAAIWSENSTNAVAFCDRTGDTRQYVAEWEGAFSFSYETGVVGSSMLFKPALDVLYSSGYHTTDTLDEDAFQDEYFQFNGRLAFSDYDGIWEVALTGENLTDERIIGYAAEVPLARIQGSKSLFGFVRPGRTLGLNLRYNFY